jgi:hypothetical protein
MAEVFVGSIAACTATGDTDAAVETFSAAGAPAAEPFEVVFN